MRNLRKRGIAMLGAAALAVTLAGCSAADEAASTSTSQSPTEAAAAAETAAAKETKSAEPSTVESIDAMVEQLGKKKYSCKSWEQTDDVEGAEASGTCNGEDQIMVFADEAGVKSKMAELDKEGTAYVFGDNWIVANTNTPTFVRNALGGTAVASGAAS